MLSRLTYLLLLLLVGCSGIDAYTTVREESWKRRNQDLSVVIGYFDIRGAQSELLKKQLRTSLKFHLQSLGYTATDYQHYESVFAEKSIPMNEPLSERQFFLIAGSIKERFLLQGYLQKVHRFAIPEDIADTMLSITATETVTGLPAAEFQLFHSDTEGHTAYTVFSIAGHFATEFHSINRKHLP